MAEDEQVLPGIDIRRPNMARMYDYALGGKDNFASDREAVQNLFRLAPENAYVPKANRQFLGKAVRFAAEQGIGQFLDLGAGLPSQGSTHEVARPVQPDARVVYVDSDPVVLTHARALLVGIDSGLAIIDEDIRDTERILEHPRTRRLIDFSQPAAVLFVAVLHGIPDADDPAGIVAKYVRRLAPGRYVILSHLTRLAAAARGRTVRCRRHLDPGRCGPQELKSDFSADPVQPMSWQDERRPAGARQGCATSLPRRGLCPSSTRVTPGRPRPGLRTRRLPRRAPRSCP